MTLVLSKL